MTLKNNRAHLLWYCKLCASFRSHWWVQTGVTVRKRQIWVKIDNFFSRVILQFDGWHWKKIRKPLLSNIKLMHHFITMCEFKLELQSRNGLKGSWPLWLWLLTLTFCLDVTFVTGTNSWKFHVDTMMGNSQKGVTDGQTDGLNHL